jgi:hypothetical protein
LTALLLLLLGGAIVNIAVAWSLSLLIDPFSIEAEIPRFRWGQRIIHDDRQWLASIRWRAGAARLVAVTGPARDNDQNQGEDPDVLLPRWWRAGRFSDQPAPGVWAKLADRQVHQLPEDEVLQFQSQAEARGWPALSMWYELRLSTLSPVLPRMLMEARGGLETRLPLWRDPMVYSSYDQPRALPLRIIWPGFLINTLFYAICLWILLAIPRKLRRWRRFKRGLCSKCGYDLRSGGSLACPECGAARSLRAS